MVTVEISDRFSVIACVILMTKEYIIFDKQPYKSDQWKFHEKIDLSNIKDIYMKKALFSSYIFIHTDIRGYKIRVRKRFVDKIYSIINDAVKNRGNI